MSFAALLSLALLAVDPVPPAGDPAAFPTDPAASPSDVDSPAMSTELLPALRTYVAARQGEFARIPEARKVELGRLASYVDARRAAGEPVRLTFICTHNSRRSHLGQAWAAVAAAVYGVEGVATYSGGTEGTAFNPRAVAALKRAGFQIESNEAETNPHYAVTFAEDAPATTHFSKRYDAEPNPQSDFAAIMVCTDADEACPVVAGAAFRLALPYEDPKVADDTPLEAERYDERTAQIGREMLYAFSKVR